MGMVWLLGMEPVCLLHSCASSPTTVQSDLHLAGVALQVSQCP